MPSDIVWLAIIAGVPATIAAIGTYLNGRAIRKVHDCVNELPQTLKDSK